MKAIRTFYKGPTDTRGARMWATDDDGNRTHVPYNHALDDVGRHREAAVALCEKMKWTGLLAGGFLGRNMVWVWLDSPWKYLVAVKDYDVALPPRVTVESAGRALWASDGCPDGIGLDQKTADRAIAAADILLRSKLGLQAAHTGYVEVDIGQAGKLLIIHSER